jgi:hypothetical protein
MPSKTQIDAIRDNFAKLYNIDVVKLKKDAEKIAASLNKRANSRDIYLRSISPINPIFLVQDLEEFAFSSVPEDKDIRDRLIEQNLETACRLLQTCFAMRREYYETAKLYVDTILKSEEFFFLDYIHQQEVAAGLYELPYQEAKIEFDAAQAAQQKQAQQHQIAVDVFETPIEQVGWGEY